MTRTEFHVTGGDDDLELGQFFTPREVRVEGSFRKFEVDVEINNRVTLTTRDWRETMSVDTVRNLIESLQDAIEYTENHPRPPRGGAVIRKSKDE